MVLRNKFFLWNFYENSLDLNSCSIQLEFCDETHTLQQNYFPFKMSFYDNNYFEKIPHSPFEKVFRLQTKLKC